MSEKHLLLDLFGIPDNAANRLREMDPVLEVVRCKRGDETYHQCLGEAQIIVGWPAVDDLPKAFRLRWLQLPSAGADAYAGRTHPGVILTNSKGVFGIPIAEHVLAMMLALAIRLPEMVRSQQKHQWQRPTSKRELLDTLCLIVGLGDIGLQVAKRTHGLGMRNIGVKRTASRPPEFVNQIATLDELEQLLPQADHIVLALPGTSHTHHLFDAARLARCKKGACLYNVGRGSVVDEPALIHALQTGQLGGAGLDVFETEPLPPESPLWQMPNVIITPHFSGHSLRHAERFGALLERNFIHYIHHEPLDNQVNAKWGY